MIYVNSLFLQRDLWNAVEKGRCRASFIAARQIANNVIGESATRLHFLFRPTGKVVAAAISEVLNVTVALMCDDGDRLEHDTLHVCDFTFFLSFSRVTVLYLLTGMQELLQSALNALQNVFGSPKLNLSSWNFHKCDVRRVFAYICNSFSIESEILQLRTSIEVVLDRCWVPSQAGMLHTRPTEIIHDVHTIPDEALVSLQLFEPTLYDTIFSLWFVGLRSFYPALANKHYGQ